MLNIFSRNRKAIILLKAANATLSARIRQTYVKASPARVRRQATSLKMYRKWEVLEKAASAQNQYNLLSYNILAQDLLLAHFDLYMNTDTRLLRWEYRLRRLAEEIHQLKPDILCLQEMQYTHLKEFVRNIRDKRQLEYVFKKKTGNRTDGCAIIYDRSKFRLLEERGLEYHTPNIKELNRENIALLAKFSVRGPEEGERLVVVATTHLLYNPKRHDVRTAQVEVLLSALQEFAAHTNAADGSTTHLPIVLTGDFNFVSDSMPFRMLTSSSESRSNTNPHLEEDASTEQIDVSTETKLGVGHDLQMVPLNFGQSSGSTFQENWVTVDYILHSLPIDREPLKVWSVYKLPSVGDCARHGHIPNHYFGSDHFSMAIKFSV